MHATTLPLTLMADIANWSQSYLRVIRTNVVVMVKETGVGKPITRIRNELREETDVKSHTIPTHPSAGLDRAIYISCSRDKFIPLIWIYAKPGTGR